MRGSLFRDMLGHIETSGCDVNRSTCSLTLLNDIEVVEDRRTVGEGHRRLCEDVRLGQSRVLHRFLIGVEVDDDEMTPRLIPVLADHTSLDRTLTFGSLVPVVGSRPHLVDFGSLQLHDLNKRHRSMSSLMLTD